MAIESGRCRPGRGRRRIGSSITYSSLLLAATLTGCSSPHGLRWPGPTESPRGTQPAQVPRDQADDGRNAWPPEFTGRSKAQAADPARAEPAGAKADGGIHQTAAQSRSESREADVSPVIPPPDREYPIDLSTALRLAEVENPLIAEARQRIGETLAVQQKAYALLLPNLNVGTNFHNHTGNLQRSSGRILKLDEKSLYVGGGAAAIAASPVEVPAVNIVSELTDAFFEPLAARQQVEGAKFNASATANRILLEVAELHFELLAAEADLRVRLLSAEQEAEVARLTRAYAEAQQGRDADAERAATELSLIEVEIRQAEEGVAVASSRLAHRLHLDQTVRIKAVAPVVEQVTLVDPGTPLEGLIRAAVRGRPEVGATGAAIGVAETRHKEERYRPFLPSLRLGFSGGAFGGGSNLVGDELGNFRGRTDFDVQVFWTARNLGLGNLSRVNQRFAEVGQAVAAQSRAIAEVRSQVAAAHAEVAASRQEINLAARRLASAEAGFREDLERIRNTVGRPIEVVNSLRLLNEARVARIRALTLYNKSEFRLFVALGTPPPLGVPSTTPTPPAPIALPPLPPLAAGVAPAHARNSRPVPPAVARRASR